MDIEHIGESPISIRFRFDADETEVLRAVYREKIAALAKACNPSAIVKLHFSATPCLFSCVAA